MKNALTTFYIVRHGETEWNAKRLIQGQKDSPLTENGINQAQLVAKKLSHISFDMAFSSDLLRAKRTAEIIIAEKKLIVETTELLRERNFKHFEGKHRDALRAFDAYYNSLNDQGKFTYSNEGIESDESMATRMVTFLRETALTHPGKTILIGSHSGIIRATLIHLGFGTYTTLPQGSIRNSAWARIESDGIDFFVKETEGVTRLEI